MLECTQIRDKEVKYPHRLKRTEQQIYVGGNPYDLLRIIYIFVLNQQQTRIRNMENTVSIYDKQIDLDHEVQEQINRLVRLLTILPGLDGQGLADYSVAMLAELADEMDGAIHGYHRLLAARRSG